MRVLFLEYNNYPIPDAVGNCANKLRCQMHSQGVETDVLTFRWDRSLKDAYQDDLGMVYLADSWMYHARVGRDANGKIVAPPMKLLWAVVTKTLAFLLGGRYVQEDKLPKAACKAFRKRLQELCQERQYDWVIACSSPFCMNWIAVDTPMAAKRLLYYFDPPYYAAPGFSTKPARVAARLNKEMTAWEKADLVVTAPEHRKLVESPAFDSVREKLMTLTFPNMQLPRAEAKAVPLNNQVLQQPFEEGNVNCVFLGTLYENGRQPKALLELFSAMAAYQPRLRLYLIGDKFGPSAGQQIAQYQSLLKERLIALPAITQAEGEWVMQQADVLINIGNVDQSCLPSKVFDLISVGKPILQICQVEDCNTLPFIRRYPKAFCCFSSQCGEPEAAKAAAAFCVEQAGTVCDVRELAKIYAGETARDIANKLLERMALHQ